MSLTEREQMGTEPLVSVVICTYNREKMLCDTIRQLLEQSYPNYEIVIIDQTANHLPATEAFLHDLVRDGKIRYFLTQPPSLPLARNLGVEKARGEIVLFIDDDVELDPDLITPHVNAYAEDTVGGVAGRRTIPGLEEPLEPVGLIDRWGRHISNFSSTRPATVEWASGCHMSFRRELLFRAGLFEPRFLGTAAYEDVDFSFRLRRLGYTIRFVPEAHLVHLKMQVGGCENRQRNVKYFYSAIHNLLLLFLRHYSLREFPRIVWDRVLTALSVARQKRNPLVLVPLAGAFFQVFYSYLVARKSLPTEIDNR
jgi:GT2 family glycosyltransferase